MLKWKEQLSRAWEGQDLSKDAYDYDKYYRDQPVAAWMQLYNIEANKWNPYIKSAHFPDGGRSGLYKTPQHPTYPGLGNKSWSSDGSIYYLSNQQYMNPKDDHNTDDTLDYLGSDYGYNKGGTHVVYNGANVLPTLWVLPKDKGFNLRSNKYDNGFEYKDRKQDIKIPYKQYGGLIQKYQQGKPFFTEENKERIKKSTDKAVEAVKAARKRAIFAQNSRKFKHEDGGLVHKPNGHRSILDNGWFKTKDLKKNHPLVSIGQQGLKLHADNPYLDAVIELSPLGDARDIYEGINSGNYQQSVDGLIGLGGTLLGVSVLPKLIKGYKAYKKLNKANKIIKTSPFRIVRNQAYNDGRAAYNTLHRMPYYRIASSIVAKGVDGINDLKSVFDK